MADERPKRRGPRRLSEEERELWSRVAASVEPMPVRRRARKAAVVVEEPAAPPSAPEPPAIPPIPTPAPKKGRVVKAELPKAPPGPPPPPPLAPIDRRTTQKLGRGTVTVDGRIDLHGLTQDAARRRLVAFLGAAQGRGDKLVLVITGKGSREADADPLAPGRGVLRRVVPEWLALPSLRTVVVGFSPARPEHGGDGALYVRLRRAR